MNNWKRTGKISINQKWYDTFFDEHGIRRFMRNAALCHLFNTGKLDMNQLSIDYQKGKFSQIEYLEFNMALGYSVFGIRELSSFEDLTFTEEDGTIY